MKDGTHLRAEQHGQWMLQAAQLHGTGKPELALVAFETALALAPGDLNTASACATLLSELDRPEAAYRTLLSVEDLLLNDADGAANLAIAAESCGDLEKAQASYARALALDPDHLRTLNNVSILAASAGRWDLAVELARKCLALAPQHPSYHANLAEFLSGAQRFHEGLQTLTTAIAQFPDSIELRVRHIVLLAFNGELEKSDAATAQLGAEGRKILGDFLLNLEAPEDRHLYRTRTRNNPPKAPDALDILAGQSFRNLALCDWRNNASLTAILRASLARTSHTIERRHWHLAPFYGMLLGLNDDELEQMERESLSADLACNHALLPPFTALSKVAAKKDHRIHVGIALDSLNDEGQFESLVHHLAHHNASRFAIHVYAFTPRPEAKHAEQLRSVGVTLVELGHMSDVEVVARIRLDRLDVYVEIAPELPFRRSLISALRVAPVQIQRSSKQSQSAPGLDYNTSDEFLHPEASRSAWASSGTAVAQTSSHAIAETRPTCELSVSNGPDLAEETLVLCALTPPEKLDPQSFAAWMKIMRSLPDAVLWLPRCARGAINLVREANAAGVGGSRLLFSNSSSRATLLARLSQASLCLDTFRTSSAVDLAYALNAGIPAITLAGHNTSCRSGASIMRAAGMPQCVMPSGEAYVSEAVRLGRDEQALAALKESLLAARLTAPRFDVQSHVQQWESALTTMVERLRAGLSPAAFNIAPSSMTPDTTSNPS